MGLDQYIFSISKQDFQQVLHSIGQEHTAEEYDHVDVQNAVYKLEEAAIINFTHFHYWRKHPNLHGWFQGLYFDKGGRDRNFNCSWVEISSGDLEELEADIRSASLPETEGPFFGQSDGSEKDYDLAFIRRANTEIGLGNRLFYSSWW